MLYLSERRKLEESESDLASDDGDEGKILNLDGGDEDVWDEESTYLELLAEESARLREAAEKSRNGEEAEVSSSDEEELEEELGFISPLDVLDPYVTFKHALTTFQMQNSPLYQASTTALSVEEQTALMEIMRKAESSATASAA